MSDGRGYLDALQRRVGLLLWGACLVAILAPSIGGSNEGDERVDRVILVTIDTLRADHLGIHGYPRDTSPFLDSLARRGVFFRNAFSTSSLTAVSHASLFTSLYPGQHGVLRNWEKIGEDDFSMARMFQRNGFETAGFPSVRFLGGMRPGFDTFKDDVRIMRQNWHKSAKHQNASQTIDRVVVWLHEERVQDRFFVWIHLFDVHQYSPKQHHLPRYEEMLESQGTTPSPEFKTWLIANQHVPNTHHEDFESIIDVYNRYDVQIRFVDDQLGRLFRHMEKAGFAGNTLWVITSDHGEGLGDHEYGGHSEYLYNEQVHVPAILYLKDSTRLRGEVAPLVRHVDLLPTLAELIGYSLPATVPAIRGESFLSLLDAGDAGAPPPERLAYSQRGALGSPEKPQGGQLRALQSLREKYIVHREGEGEFFWLSVDPFELHNGVRGASAERAYLESRIAEIVAESETSSIAHEGRTFEDVDPRIIEELRALGYLEAD